jgi:toxin ParE1/3/4
VTPAWLRPQAEADLVEKIRYYRAAGGDRLGDRFVSASVASLRTIERSPGVGSMLMGERCDIPGLRAWSVRGFPVRWYYFVTHTRLDVVRLLAGAQDLPPLLADSSDE